MLYSQIQKNKRKTAILFFVIFLVFSIIGGSVSYLSTNNWLVGMIGVNIAGFITILFMLHRSTASIMKSAQATYVTESSAPQLYHLVEDMAMVAQIPRPDIYIIDTPEINAFATGLKPENSSIAVTKGILQKLNREELEGVIGHEMTHIANHDCRTMTIIMALGAVISTITSIIFTSSSDDTDSDDAAAGIIMFIIALIFVLLSNTIMFFMQMAISRSQEYSADAGSVKLTRNPQGLINALQKIENEPPMPIQNKNLAALYFGPVDTSNWSSTHPSTEKRITALKKL